MTISSAVRKAGPFTGNGVTTVFPFGFKVFDKTNVKVLLVVSGGASTTLVLDSDYSVLLNANQDSSPGGTITYPITGAILPSTSQLVMLGDLPYDQETDITNSGGFYPSIIEDMSDRSTIQIQQLAENVSRAIVLNESETASPSLPTPGGRANTLLGFDGVGNVEVYPITASVGAGVMTAEGPFLSGVQFTGGTTTTLQLSQAYGVPANVMVHFDGTYQGTDQYTLVGTQIIFNSPIPAGTQQVYIVGGTSLSLYLPADGQSVPPGTAIYNLINSAVNVKNWGAKGDGVSFDTVAINAAETYAASVGKALYFPAGSYLLAVNATVSKLSGVPWVGDGRKRSVIKAAPGAWTNAMISGGNVSNASLWGMGFDFSASTFHAFLRNIFFTTFTDGEIAECEFLQQAIGFQCDGGTRFSIHHNTFTQNTAYGNFINEAVWITRNTSIPTNYSFCDNVCRNVGTDFDGDVAVIARNNIQSWQYGAGITTEVNSFGFTIADNYCAGGGPNLDGNGVPPDGIECWTNESVVKGNTVIACAGVGINVGGSNMICDGNLCLNNGTYGGVGNVPSYRAGITLRYLSAQINGNTSLISNNVCVDTGGGTQLWGITDDSVNCGGSVIANNLFIGAVAPSSLSGIRYDFKGPKLQAQATGQAGVTVASGSQVVGNAGFAMSGAQLGDQVTVNIVSQNLQGMAVVGWVVSAGVVAWSFLNMTGASKTIAAYTANVCVEKPLNYANY